MQVKNIAERSKGSNLQYFWPSLSYYLSLRSLFCLFLSGCFTQVLLYITHNLVNVLNSKHFPLSTLIRAGIRKYACQNSKLGRPWSDCFFSLVWVCHVCLGLFGWQLVFEILENLPYSWVKVFRVIPEYRICRLTFHRNSASKCWIKEIIIASLIGFQVI